MNICANCEHHLPLIGDGTLTVANICRAPEVGFEPAINPVTGVPCYTGKTDDGDLFYAEGPHPLCIWINPRGQCPYFTAKQPEHSAPLWIDSIGEIDQEKWLNDNV